MDAIKYIGLGLMVLGAVFLFLGALGIYRMPDVYNRLQAGTKATTLGFLSIALGVLFFKPEWSLKIVIIMAFMLLTNPIGSHSLSRASKDTGIKPFVKKQKNQSNEIK